MDQTIGRGQRKVSWRVGRNFGNWHRIRHEVGHDIETWCSIPVPPLQNAGRSFTIDAMPLLDVCSRCFPQSQPQADGDGA